MHQTRSSPSHGSDASERRANVTVEADRGPMSRLAARTLAVLRDHQAVTLLVLVMLLVRYLIADLHSYWYDEVLSVGIYGAWNPSVGAAIANLAENSVHPPVYQFILYHWMSVFGESEVATRTLSNLYIAGATVLLYLAADRAWNRWVAFWTAAIFSTLHIPLYYAIETRSYAQSILIAALSTYAVVRTVQEVPSRSSFTDLTRSPATVLLLTAATLLLLTHYFNAFLWAVQASFLAVYLATLPRVRISSARRVAYVAMVYGLSAGIFLLVWGRQTLHHYHNHAERHELEEAPQGPLENLLSSTITPNLRGPGAVILLLFLAAIVIVVQQAVTRQRDMDIEDHRNTVGLILYAGISLVLPLFVAWGVFHVVGAERHSDRYFTYLTPSLAVVLAVTAYGLNLWARRLFPERLRAAATIVLAALSIVALVIVIAPRTADVATERRYDWRALVERSLDIIEADDDRSFIVYQSGFRQIPLLNVYFEQMSDTVRVAGTIRRGEQDRSGPMDIEEAHEEIADHDFLIVLFPHLPTTDYDEALARLEAAYDVHLRQLDQDGRGLIVYRVGES